MGTETYLRVGIDGTGATSGERVVVRSLDNISNSATNTSNSIDRLEKKIGGCGNRAPEVGSVVKRTMKEITESVEVAGVSISTLENMFIRLIARTAMIAGIYTSLGMVKSAIKESLEYLGQIETSGLSIAASFLSGGQYIDQTTQKALQGSAALRAAQADSASVIEQLKVANLQTSATLDQLIYAYQVTLPEAQAKSFNRKQIMDYTLAMIQAAGAIGLPYAQIAEETRDMLKGAVNSRNTRIATVLGMGPQNQEYMDAVRKGGTDLYDYLMKRLEGFRLAGIETQKTWNGLWSNMKDIGKIGGGIAAESLFEAIKAQMIEIQHNLVSIDAVSGKINFNPEFIKTATETGKTIGNIFYGFVEGTKYVYEHLDAIKLAAEMYIGYRVTMLASSMAQKAVNAIDLESAGIIKAREALRVEGLAVTMRVAQEEAKVTAAHLADAEATAASMFADREAAAAKVALIEADLALVSSAANLQAISLQNAAIKTAEKAATLDSIRLKMEELATDSLQGGNQMLREEALMATKQFNIAKGEEVNIRRSLAQLKNRETVLSETLSSSIVRESVLTDELNAAKARQSILTDHYKVSTVGVLIATEANTTATIKATLATDAHAIATTAASIGTAMLTGATNALKTAMSFLGGRVGTIITLLGLGATAWMIWGNESRKAVDEADQGLDGVLKKLTENNRLLAEQARMAKDIPKDASPEVVRATLFSDKDAKAYDESLARAKTIQDTIDKLGGPVAQTTKVFSTLGGSADNANMRVQGLMIALDKEKQLERNVVEAAIKNNELKKAAESKYVQTPRITPPDTKAASELAAMQKQVQDAWLSYDNAFTNRKVDAQKNETKILQNELTGRNSMLLLSQQQYIDQKEALDKKGIAIELKAVADRRQKLLSLLKAKGVSNSDAMDPDNERNKPDFSANMSSKSGKDLGKIALIALKDELELRSKVQDSLKETSKLQTEGAISAQNASTSTLKNVRDLAKAYSDVKSSMQSMMGDTVGAVKTSEGYKQGELNKQSSSISSLGPPDINSAQQLLNISREIDASNMKIAQTEYDRLKINTELKAQLLDQAGLTGQAQLLRDSIKPMDPSKLGLDATTSAMDKMIDRLKEIANWFNEIHRNDTIKFNIEDQGTDQFTKRERDIQREYTKTKEKKTADLQALFASEKGTAAQIKAVNEDLNLADAQKSAMLYQLKKDMMTSYASTAADLMGQLAASMDQSNETSFKAAKALSMGQIIISTAVAAMRAYSDLGPIAGTIAAVAIAGIGAIQLAKVASTSYKGGGSVGGVSGGFSGGGGSAGGTNSGTVGGGSVGSSIGTPIGTQLTQAALQDLAKSSENASLAITKVADGLTNIADLFKSGSMGGQVAGSLSSPTTGQNGSGMGNSMLAGGVDSLAFNIGGAVSGAALGTIPIPGDVVGGMINGFLSNVFFGSGNSWQTKGTGVSLGLKGGALDGGVYAEQEKKGGWFTGNKSRTETGNMDPLLANSFQSALDKIVGTVNKAVAALGTSSDLSKVNLPTEKIQTSGKTPEEIQKELTTWFTKAADSIGQSVEGLKEFTFYGESAFDAITRLGTSLQGVNEGLSLTGHKLISATLAGGNMAYKIADAMGGLDKLQTAQDNYFSKMFTQGEQDKLRQLEGARKLSVGIKEMNATYTDLNWTIPKTNTEFRALVDSLDLNTDKGASLYVSLMNLVPAMDEMTSAATKASKTLQDAFLNTALSAAQALKDITGGNLSTLTPRQQLMQQEAAFANAIAVGNTKALPELGKTLLNTAKGMYGSGSGYQTEYNNVTAALANQAGITGPLTMSAIDSQILAITSVQDEIANGTIATVNSIKDLQLEIALLNKQLKDSSDATIAATISSGGTVVDAIEGTFAAVARA